MQELPHYRDYYWRNGKPYGQHVIPIENIETFKVISDPYGKRYSVEKYSFGKFIEVIYDSSLFDFRHLKSQENAAWQREYFEESEKSIRSYIRSMDDRMILIEEAYFKENCCTLCKILSPHGIWIATQKIFYTSSGDSFNGVILFDKAERQVISKQYAIDEETHIFTHLLSEEWECKLSL